MLNSSKFKEWADAASDYLNERQWFQELKTKWEELDPQSRNYLKFAGVGAGLLSVFFVILTAIWSVHSLKTELSEKRALLDLIQNANEEMRFLRDAVPNGGASAGRDHDSSWASYFESTAASSGVDKSVLTISTEKPGASSEQTKEALYDVNIKHVNIKQIVRYALSLETGQRPVKIRNLQIDSKGDTLGFLDATLAVSAFTVVEPK